MDSLHTLLATVPSALVILAFLLRTERRITKIETLIEMHLRMHEMTCDPGTDPDRAT